MLQIKLDGLAWQIYENLFVHKVKHHRGKVRRRGLWDCRHLVFSARVYMEIVPGAGTLLPIEYADRALLSDGWYIHEKGVLT